MHDRSDMKYWWPILEKTGVMVPRTQLVTAPRDLIKVLDGKLPDGYHDFMDELQAAAMKYGYPCFLRTGMTSGKHSYRDTCLIKSPSDFPPHVAELVEFSECCGFFGLPYTTWAVREFLKLDSSFAAFRGLPINRERRYFFSDGKIVCHHPYWPEFAIEGHGASEPDWKSKLADLNTITETDRLWLNGQTEIVAAAFDGSWSLDWAMGADYHWYAIDMAEADGSYHWPDCPNEKYFKSNPMWR